MKKLSLRVKQGVGKAYDLRRLQQQKELETQRIESLENDLREVKSELESLCELNLESQNLSGSILPGWTKEKFDQKIEKIGDNLQYRMGVLELKSLSNKQSKNKKSFLRYYNLHFGTKRLDGPGKSGSGSVFGLSAPFPLSDPHSKARKRYKLQTKLKKAQIEQSKQFTVSSTCKSSLFLLYRLPYHLGSLTEAQGQKTSFSSPLKINLIRFIR